MQTGKGNKRGGSKPSSGKPSGSKSVDKNIGYFMIPESAIKPLHDLGVSNYGEIMLLFKIYTLSLENGYCNASNTAFQEMLDCSNDTIKRYLKHLRQLDLIKKYEESFFDNEKGHKMTTKRLLYPQKAVYELCGRKMEIRK